MIEGIIIAIMVIGMAAGIEEGWLYEVFSKKDN